MTTFKIFASTHDKTVEVVTKNLAAAGLVVGGYTLPELLGIVSAVLAILYSALNIFFLLRDRLRKD